MLTAPTPILLNTIALSTYEIATYHVVSGFLEESYTYPPIIILMYLFCESSPKHHLKLLENVKFLNWWLGEDSHNKYSNNDKEVKYNEREINNIMTR